jgi:hypothetical protein
MARSTVFHRSVVSGTRCSETWIRIDNRAPPSSANPQQPLWLSHRPSEVPTARAARPACGHTNALEQTFQMRTPFRAPSSWRPHLPQPARRHLTLGFAASFKGKFQPLLKVISPKISFDFDDILSQQELNGRPTLQALHCFLTPVFACRVFSLASIALEEYRSAFASLNQIFGLVRSCSKISSASREPTMIGYISATTRDHTFDQQRNPIERSVGFARSVVHIHS